MEGGREIAKICFLFIFFPICCVPFITQMIFQQPNPGVHYEYRLPTEHTASSQHEGEKQICMSHSLSSLLIILIRLVSKLVN